MNRFRLIIISALGALAVPLVAASGASAANTGTCQFDGLAGIAVPGVESVATDAANGGPETVLTDFDTGTYHFEGAATCLKVDSDVGEAGNSGVYAVDIVSDGAYNNRVCGTGEAEDAPPTSETILTPTARLDPDPFNTGLAGAQGPLTGTYHIDFVSGQGVLDVTGGGDAQHGNGDGGGYVNIIPNDADNDPDTHPCVDEDVTEFLVTGGFVLTAG